MTAEQINSIKIGAAFAWHPSGYRRRTAYFSNLNLAQTTFWNPGPYGHSGKSP
jgi:hypothetical protein